MQVTIKDLKSGLEKTMHERYARVLVKLNRAEYLTTNVQSAPQKAVLTAQTAPAPTPQVDDLLGDETPDISKMDLPALHAHAASLGIVLHPQTGEKKVRAAILAHAK